MNITELRTAVDEIIAMAADPEAAHSEEDSLHVMLLRQFLPGPYRMQIERLLDAEFPRWRA